MTDCNRDPVTFSSLGFKSVVADFLGGRLTSDAGFQPAIHRHECAC